MTGIRSTFSVPPLIVIEGLDGVGKSTVGGFLADRIGGKLVSTPTASVRSFREEADQAFPRASPSATLFYAACNVAAAEEAQAHLHAGHPVVLDRYWLSTCAYARVLGTELPLRDVAHILPRATVTFFLKASVAARRERLAGRGRVSAHDEETLSPEVANELERAFTALFREESVGTVYTVDTTNLRQEATVTLLAQLVQNVEATLHDPGIFGSSP